MNQSMFSTQLKKARQLRKLSCRELAEKSGVSFDSISKYELDKRTPSIDAVIDLAKALDVSLEYLAGGEISAENKNEYVNKIKKELGIDDIFINVELLSNEKLKNLKGDFEIFLQIIKEKYKL